MQIHFIPLNDEADLSHKFLYYSQKTHQINYKRSSSNDLQETRRWDLRFSGILLSV
jgi:hypothetical protein